MICEIAAAVPVRDERIVVGGVYHIPVRRFAVGDINRVPHMVLGCSLALHSVNQHALHSQFAEAYLKRAGIRFAHSLVGYDPVKSADISRVGVLFAADFAALNLVAVVNFLRDLIVHGGDEERQAILIGIYGAVFKLAFRLVQGFKRGFRNLVYRIFNRLVLPGDVFYIRTGEKIGFPSTGPDKDMITAVLFLLRYLKAQIAGIDVPELGMVEIESVFGGAEIVENILVAFFFIRLYISLGYNGCSAVFGRKIHQIYKLLPGVIIRGIAAGKLVQQFVVNRLRPFVQLIVKIMGLQFYGVVLLGGGNPGGYDVEHRHKRQQNRKNDQDGNNSRFFTGSFQFLFSLP